jgi:multidrug resistance protein, MATE family
MEISANSNDLKLNVTNKSIVQMALPITLAIIIPQLNNLINSIFLGKLDKTALGNAGITGVYYLIFSVAGHGLNNAMQSVLSNHAGSGEHNKFASIVSQGIRIAVLFAIIGIVFTQLVSPFILQQVAKPADYPAEMGFLRIRILGLPFIFLFQMGGAFLISTLNSKYLMIGAFIEAATNVLLDYALIFGKLGMPKMGFNGAALASVIAEFVGMVTVVIVIYKLGLVKKYGLFTSFKFDKERYYTILKRALPLVGQYVISVSTWFIFFLLMENVGDANAKPISNVMRNVFGVAGIFIWAFSGTTNAMVSNLMGQQRHKDIVPAITKIMCWSIGCCLVAVCLLNIFPAQFFKLFNQPESFAIEGIPVIRMVSMGMMMMSIASIWLNGLIGIGKTTINLAIEILAISAYMIYSYYVTRVNYTTIAMAWSNELVYWFSVFACSFGYIKLGKWRKEIPELKMVKRNT